ncbi:phosphoribosylamine--glycine ligase [Pelagibacteraceae bacterium]|nr:phosphoribosylamine--glycine ligase [Pelagibacteraceae bacterium]
MKIALIGSGGREHAICKKLALSKNVNKIYCIPGNAGTSELSENLDIDYLNFNLLLKTIKNNKIDLVIVGPEEPLVKGIVDFLERNKIKVFGPNKYASQLEGSKSFMKKLCKENNIPTAYFKICRNFKDVKNFIKKNKLPIVVKADGIAAGKGVSICKSYSQVQKISNEIFKGKFKSSKNLVLEEFLTGEEVSYFTVVDKNNFLFFGTAQDHKRVKEGEKGPNTGGMGAYSPAPIVNKELEKKILRKIIVPTLSAMKKRNKPFTGFLYAGLIIKNGEPYLIEYNVRLGDPECQVILSRLKTDFLKIITATIENKLKKIKIKWLRKKSMTIVLCANGYPGKYAKYKKIRNLNKITKEKNTTILHAGTIMKKNQLYSNGGRVLNITTVGNNFFLIRKKILIFLKKINWRGGFYRKDIGWRII